MSNTIIHRNRLFPSAGTTKTFSNDLAERFLSFCERYGRDKNVPPSIPKDLDRDFILWRTMVGRFKKGDFRNTFDEKESMKRIADWLLKANQELCGQEEKPFEWQN